MLDVDQLHVLIACLITQYPSWVCFNSLIVRHSFDIPIESTTHIDSFCLNMFS